MVVTEVKVFPVHEDKLKAYATVTFDNCFIVRDLKIIHGHSGLFVAMPSKKRKDGSYKDTAHPLNTETRSMIESRVIEEYNRELSMNGMEPAPEPRRIDEDEIIESRIEDKIIEDTGISMEAASSEP